MKTGSTWTQQAVLRANDGLAADRFGTSVAISEDTIVVGAREDLGLESALTEAKIGGNLTLNWARTCLPNETDFEVYVGSLGNFTSHAPLLCTTGGFTTATFAQPAGNARSGAAMLPGRTASQWAARAGETERRIPTRPVSSFPGSGRPYGASGSVCSAQFSNSIAYVAAPYACFENGVEVPCITTVSAAFAFGFDVNGG